MADGKEIQALRVDKQKALSTGNWKDLAAICNYLGKQYSERGQLEQALSEHEEELKICKYKLKDENGMAIAYRNIGEVYSEMDEYKKALGSLKTYLELAEKMKDFVEIQRAWATIGRTYFMKEDLDRALTAYSTALGLADKAKHSVKESEYSEMKCRSYLNIALVYDQKDDVNEGCRYYSMAIQLATKHNLKETLHRCQNSLGLFYQKLQHLERAMKFINEAIVTVKSMKNKRFECEYLIAKGHLLLLMENPTEARHVFKKACHCKTPIQEDIQKAHFKCKKASDICKLIASVSEEENKAIDLESEEESKKSIEFRMQSYEKLGDLYAELEIYQTAIKYYQKELDLAIVHECNSSILAPIYVSLAQTHLDQKNYDEALDNFQKELELRAGNLIEETRTSLKIIETKIAMKKTVTEVIDSYEEALNRAKDDDACRLRILKDYSIFLHQESSTEKAQKVDELLASLLSQNDDEQLDLSQVEIIDDVEVNAVTLNEDFNDVSSPSSSSNEDEEGTHVITTMTGERTKRTKVKKFKTNELGETPLHRACIEGKIKEVIRLLEKGHPVNQRDNCGWLPIHEACNFGFTEIARHLIDAGANINDPGGANCGGTTPLHDSCSNCTPEVIELLVDRGADVTKLDNDGNTPIDCIRGWRRRVKELTQEEEDIYQGLVHRLEGEMKKKGFDVEAERRRPVIRVTPSSSAIDGTERRGGSGIAARSARRRMVHSPTSSPPKKKASKSARVLEGDDLELNYEDPEVARLEYQSVISNLRRQKSKYSPDNDADDADRDEDDGQQGSTKPATHPSLVNEDERIDDWLEDDVGPSTHRSRTILDLYNMKNLPKNERQINGAKRKVAKEKKSVTFASSSSTRNVTPFEDNDLLQVPSNDDTFGRNDGESDDDGSVECVSSSSTSGREVDGNRGEKGSGSRKAIEKTKTLIKVCLESKSFLMRVPDGNETISWLIQETVARYRYFEKKNPVIYLTTTDGSLLSPHDMILDVVSDGEVKAHISSFDHLSLDVGYQESCKMNQVKLIQELDQALKISESNGILNLSNMNIPRLHLEIFVDSIKSSDKIMSLDFSFTHFKSSSSSLTSKCGTSRPISASILDLVCKLPRLKELRLQGLGISEKDLDILANKSHLQITLLDLSYNSLGNSSFDSLSSLVISFPSLYTLCLIACDLDSNFFQDPRMVQLVSGVDEHDTRTSKIHQVTVDDSIHDVTGKLYQNHCSLSVHKWKKIHRI